MRAHRKLLEHLRLDAALGPELLEDRVGALVVVGPDQLQRVEPVRELVEEQVLGAADSTGLFAPGLLTPGLLAAVLIILWAAGRGVVALGHGRTVSARRTGSPGRHELLEQRLVPAHHRIAREAVLDPLARSS